MSCMSLSIVRHCVDSSSSFMERSVLLDSSSFWGWLLAIVPLCALWRWGVWIGGRPKPYRHLWDNNTHKSQELSPVSFNCVAVERYDFVDYECIQKKRILSQSRETVDSV